MGSMVSSSRSRSVRTGLHSLNGSGSRTPGYTYRHVVDRLKRAGVESALLDAACLIEAASGIPRWRFILAPERPITCATAGPFESMLSRRIAREPIAYIVGMKEFWSLPLAVGPGVLIPRPETETLVEAVLNKVRGARCEVRGAKGSHSALRTPHSELNIVDIGTGCGAIALALAREVPYSRVYAVDCSPRALRIARRNAEALGCSGRVHFLKGDLFGPLRSIQVGAGFDLIVSNPPYIPSGGLDSLPLEVAAYEPREALDGGPDGLHYYRRIIEEAPRYLREDGWLAVEVGDGQASAVIGLIRQTGAFGPAKVARDLAGRIRVVLAPRRPSADG